LWVDGKLVVDRWRAQSTREWSGRLRLQAGRRYSLSMEFFERTGAATAKLLWSGPGISKQVVLSRRLFPTSAPAPPVVAQCSDGRDNDGDGRTDHPSDPGCGSAPDATESPDPSPPAPPTGPDAAERWSDPATWGTARVPQAGDTVTIPADKTVLLDRSTTPLAGLEVHRTLVFDDDYLTLTSDWVLVHGKLQIGAADKPFS
jgi:hypothetical protein